MSPNQQCQTTARNTKY